MAASAGEQLCNCMPNRTCLHRCAGVRARGGISGYGQPKEDKRGAIPSIAIKTMIYNIFNLECDAPTRISGQALFQKVRFAQPSAAFHTT